MVESLREFLLSTFSPTVSTFIVASLPVVELRGAIPIGVWLELPLGKAFIVSVLGNLVPIIPLVYGLEYFFKLLCRVKIGERFVCWIRRRAEARSHRVKMYQAFGLMLFVGVPFPGTGVWTGSVVAQLCGIRRSHQLLAMAAGVLIAGTIVTVFLYLGIESYLWITR